MALASSGRPSDGDLSSRLAELAKPSVRSGTLGDQAEALSVPAEGPGSLLRDGNRILVEVRFAHGAAAGVDDLRAAGAEILAVSPQYQIVTVAARPGELRRLAGVPRVSSAMEVLTPFVSASTCPAGAVVSEGDVQLNADGAREGPPTVDGDEIEVGVLSDSFGQATGAADGSGPVATTHPDDVANGDLPGFANTCAGQQTPVEILADTEGAGADEGRAMAQIVHDLAPRADLAFATAFTGETAFAENIEGLAKSPAEGGAGASVIVDDVFYAEEPFFQEGPIGVAVRRATDDGAAYFSAAGNDNVLDSSGRAIGSWEAAAFRDSGACPPAPAAIPELQAESCMDFHPGSATDRTFGIELAPHGTLRLDLQWSEPWLGVGTDLDAFLLDSSGEMIAASAEDNPGFSQMPFEFIGWENETGSDQIVQLAVNRFSGGLPRLKLVLLENGSGDVTGIEYPSSTGTDVVGPTIFGHSGTAAAISVAAVPFNSSSAPEPYSSRGPATHYFGPVEGGGPAGQLPSPEALSKPDLAATDCGQTTFFAFFALSPPPAWRFCGTSAAAPHAAAAAALMLDADPSATPAEIRAALLSSATPVSGGDDCSVGTGLVEAAGAVQDLLGPPPAVEPECKPPAPGNPENAQALGFWGSESPPSVPPTPPSTAVTPGAGTSPNSSSPSPKRRPSLPRTFIWRRPPTVLRTDGETARAVFRFGSDETGVSFLCKFDRAVFRTCRRRIVWHAEPGRHVLRVKARDADGNVDPTPAVFRFRVKRVE